MYLKDVAKVELDSEFYNIYSDVDKHPAAAIMFKQTEGSNAKEVIENIKAKLQDLRKSFPPQMDYKLGYDVSRFIDASIEKVFADSSSKPLFLWRLSFSFFSATRARR